MLPSVCQQIWKTQQWSQDWKGQFSFQSQRKAMTKNAQTTTKLYSSHTSKVMLKILQERLQQYMNRELPDVQARFRKGSRTRDEIANIHWTTEKQIRENQPFCFIDYAKAFDCVDHNKLWKTVKEMGIPDHLFCLLRNFKKQQLELDKEQWTGSKLGKEYIKAAYCHHAYSTYMHSTSCEMLGWMKRMIGWMKHKLESRLQEKYQ